MLLNSLLLFLECHYEPFVDQADEFPYLEVLCKYFASEGMECAEIYILLRLVAVPVFHVVLFVVDPLLQ